MLQIIPRRGIKFVCSLNYVNYLNNDRIRNACAFFVMYLWLCANRIPQRSLKNIMIFMNNQELLRWMMDDDGP